MPCPPDPLVMPTQLSRYGVPGDFLSQFDLIPFQVQISVAGVLGVMAFQWRRGSADSWSADIVSSAGTTWVKVLDEVYAEVTFAAATYVSGNAVNIDASGVVTPTSGTPPITAARFYRPSIVCSEVSNEAMTRMRDAIRPPLLVWGDDARGHAARWAEAVLRRSKGATPQGVGAGDDQVFTAEKAAKDFFDDIGKNGRPDSMTDSSSSPDGPLFPAYPLSDTLRGW